MEWKRANASKIIHIAGYEEKFVDTVLARIPSICPDDVVPQYEFLCDRGIRRRIDFMVINVQKGYLLPIELDGAEQPGIGRIWREFLERQNALIRKFGTVFRYSNSKMFDEPDVIIREISEELQRQNAVRPKPSTIPAPIVPTPIPAAIPVPAPTPIPVPDIWVRPEGVQSPKERAKSAHQGREALLAGTLGALCTMIILASPAFQNRNGTSQTLVPNPMGTAALADVSMAPEATITAPVWVPQKPPAAIAPADAGMMPQPSAPVPAADSTSENFIPASQAQFFIGQHEVVCGRVAGSREIPAGLFISLDNPYPDEVMTVVIWREHVISIGHLQLGKNQRMCISGLIRAYRGKPQVEVSHREQIQP
jgi:hypothetical protein